jgi:hypothetical protein
MQALQKHKLRVGGRKWFIRERESWGRKWPNLLPPTPLLRSLWAKFCKQLTMFGGKKKAIAPLVFPTLPLDGVWALDMDHSSFFHLAQFQLLLPLAGLLPFTTWSSHSLGIPLWQQRFHPKPGPWSMKQSLSQFTCLHYIFFPFTT